MHSRANFYSYLTINTSELGFQESQSRLRDPHSSYLIATALKKSSK